MQKVKCRHCLSVRKVAKVDPLTKKAVPGEYWNLCDCEIFGDMQEVGYDCGRKFCSVYAEGGRYGHKKD